MRRGLTPLALPLLGLGFLVCVGFFAPSYFALAQVGTTTQTRAPNSNGGSTADSFIRGVIASRTAAAVTAARARAAAPGATQADQDALAAAIAADEAAKQSLADQTAKDAAAYAASHGGTGSCSLWDGNLGDCLGSIMATVISGILWIILSMVAGILGLANYLLGWSTYITVFQFGNLVGNSDGLIAAWGVMRDVANIVLLFGFIFLGVSTILNLPHSEYTAKKAIPALIIFALLLNFSLFAVEAVIDVSNAFATSIYQQATGGSGVCESDTSTIDCIFQQGIGGQVMSMSGMTSIYDFSSNNTFGVAGGDSSTTVVVYAGLIVFAVITTLVLFAAAIMLIIRAVVLAFLMVTAPIGFAGMAIPPLHEMAKKWWKELLSQAFFAPIYFLLALLSLKIMSGVIEALAPPPSAGGSAQQNLAAVFTASVDGAKASNITIVMTFALIIGFMVAALMFAKSSSAHGTSIAMAGAGKMAFGTLGFVGRQTGGRVSLLAANKIASSRIGQTSFGRGLYNVANKGASSSFDFRQTASAKKAEGVVGGMGTVRKSVQHGMHGIEEDKKKAKVEYAKNIVQSHHEIEQQEALEAERAVIANERAADEARLNQAGQPLQQAVADQVTENSNNQAARASEIASVRANLNQAVANGTDPQAFQDQVNQLLATNATLTQNEQAALQTRRQALQAHQTAATQALAGYDRRTQRVNTELNGGDFVEANGTTTSFTGITTDAKRRRYGQNLRNSVASRLAGGTIAGHTDFEAGREVIRNAGRTGTERAIADLQNALSQNNPPPPAAPPAAGGGHGGGHP